MHFLSVRDWYLTFGLSTKYQKNRTATARTTILSQVVNLTNTNESEKMGEKSVWRYYSLTSLKIYECGENYFEF